MLAVLLVDPSPGENPAEVFASVVAQANATPEPDRIELVAESFLLDTLFDPQSIVITSDITIVGASPRSTQIVSAAGVAAIRVGETGSLRLENVSLYASFSEDGGGIVNDGQTTLENVAVIGLGRDSTFSSVLSLQSPGYTLLSNTGSLSIKNSALVDSVGNAIVNFGELDVSNTLVAGNSGVAIASGVGVGQDATTVVRDSALFGNQAGIVNFGSLDVSGTTITGNHQHYFGGINHFGGAGLLDIDPSNLIAGNTSARYGDRTSVRDSFTSDVVDINLPLGSRNQTFGELDVVLESVSSASVVVDSRGFVDTSKSLLGVNVDVQQLGNGIQRIAGNSNRVLLFQDASSGEFMVTLPGTTSFDSIVADDLRSIDFPGFIAGDDRIGLGELVFPDNFTIGDRNAWSQLQITNVQSNSGLAVVSDVLDRSFGYKLPPNFRGSDSITVTGIGLDGMKRTGTINVQVSGAGIDVQIDAVERANSIEVNFATDGSRAVDAFDLSVRFNPEIVRFVGGAVSPSFPNLTRAVSDTNGVASIAGQRGIGASGVNLGTLRFERIAEGSADIRLDAELGFFVLSQQQSLPPASLPVQYRAFDGVDTNRDGKLTARDALVVINALGRGASGNGEIDVTSLSANDVNGDGKVSALDALQIINALARNSSSNVEGEVPHQFAVSSIFADSVIAQWNDDSDDEDDIVGNLF